MGHQCRSNTLTLVLFLGFSLNGHGLSSDLVQFFSCNTYAKVIKVNSWKLIKYQMGNFCVVPLPPPPMSAATFNFNKQNYQDIVHPHLAIGDSHRWIILHNTAYDIFQAESYSINLIRYTVHSKIHTATYTTVYTFWKIYFLFFTEKQEFHLTSQDLFRFLSNIVIINCPTVKY